MMEKKCSGSLSSDAATIVRFSDQEITRGVSKHADPKWWKGRDAMSANPAYLRRWGALLRREARRRGLL